MRCFIAAVLLAGALMCPKEVEALDCAWIGSWLFRAADDGGIPEEERNRDLEARATLELLERTPIIFRGRIASARYLSDPHKTNVPTSLLIFDHVEILKGRLAKAPADRRAFIKMESWCGSRCSGEPAHWLPRGDTIVVGARPNEFVDPSTAVDFSSKKVIYRGRIDAVLGMCDVGQLTPLALQLLNAPEEEIARLKREYPPRRPN